MRTITIAMRLMLAGATLGLGACASQPAKPDETKADADLTEVYKGVQMVRSGQIQAAIDGPLTDVVNRFETKYAYSDKRVYSARGPVQGLLYMMTAASDAKAGRDTRSAIALGPAWGMAYWARGHAYAEMARYPEAEVELKKAVALSPSDAQYQNELAYALQAQHRYADSLALYEQVPGMVPLMDDWPDTLKNEYLCKAYRGQGYNLSELGRFDDAEKAYGECLKIIPDEPKSKGELAWIAEHKAKKP